MTNGDTHGATGQARVRLDDGLARVRELAASLERSGPIVLPAAAAGDPVATISHVHSPPTVNRGPAAVVAVRAARAVALLTLFLALADPVLPRPGAPVLQGPTPASASTE